MGQKGLMARYPMHWHMMGPVDGQYFAQNSVWKSFNRCVTVHGTEQRPGRGQRLLRSPGPRLLPRGRSRDRQSDRRQPRPRHAQHAPRACCPTDSRAATFWITNPDNTIRGNVAAGSTGFGFWYALPASPTGLSTGSPLCRATTPLREFSGNVAHSNRRPGLNVDDGPMADGNTETTYYSPRTDPANANTAVGRRLHRLHGVQALAAARSGSAGAISGSRTRCWPTTRSARRSPRARPSWRMRCSWASRRTTRAGFPAGTPRRGYEFYDGRVGADRVTFVNYTAAGSIPSSALGFNRNNGFSVSTGNFAGAVEFINAKPYYLETPARRQGRRQGGRLPRSRRRR